MARPTKAKKTYLEVVAICKERVESLNKKNGISAEDFSVAILEKISIKSYLPLVEKSRIATQVNVIKRLLESDEVSNVEMAIELEYQLFYKALIGYTTLEIPREEQTYDNYDLFCQSGLYDLIYEVCKFDYNRLVKIIKDAFRISENQDVLELLEQFDTRDFKSSMNQLYELFKDDKKVKMMNDLLAFNDPALAAIKDAIYSYDADEARVRMTDILNNAAEEQNKKEG